VPFRSFFFFFFAQPEFMTLHEKNGYIIGIKENGTSNHHTSTNTQASFTIKGNTNANNSREKTRKTMEWGDGQVRVNEQKTTTS